MFSSEKFYYSSMIFSPNGADELSNYKKTETVELSQVASSEIEATESVQPMNQITNSGGGQAESNNFSLNTTSEMVDPFTGDFSYTIPLMDVEGYPIVLNYNSNVSMTDEASWVGLGWNLNVGSVSREMRGIPDEYDGSQNIERIYSVKENDISSGVKYGASAGIFWKGTPMKLEPKFGLDLTVLGGHYHNAYVGNGNTFDFNIGGKASMGENFNFGLKTNLGFSRDSKNGIGRSSTVGGNVGYEAKGGLTTGIGYSWGSNYQSRSGVYQRTLGTDLSVGAKSSIVGLRTSFGSTFTVGSITSTPKLELNSKSTFDNAILNLGFSTRFKKSKWGYYVGIEFQGYSMDEDLYYSVPDDKKLYHPAYGFFHSEKRQAHTGNDSPVMDFTREHDSELSEETVNLAFSNPTYDVFYVNGLGIQSTFRGHRRDVGTYSDDFLNKESDANIFNLSAGIDKVGISPEYTIGFTFTDGSGGAQSGKWKKANDPLKFGSDEGVFFKGIGEATPTDESLLNLVGGVDPAALELEKVGSYEGIGINKTNNLIFKNGGSVNLTSTAIGNATEIDLRANIYKPILASEFPVTDYEILVYQENSFVDPITDPLTRQDIDRKSNHISAIEVLTSDGMNYTYGIPVYSYKESDVVFTTCSQNANSQGLISYTADTENSINNECGIADLFDKNTLPSYASSYLLTSVTSSDYIDLSDNGFTVDDIGSYYKMNHTRIYGSTSSTSFKSRYPICGGTDANPEAPEAVFYEGLLSIDSDNTASYSYSEKEIWYTHSVESKNLIAEFVLEDREDGFGVIGENGELATTKPLKRLKQINLYNRNERLTNEDAKPLQVVEFIYDYSTCLGTRSNINTYPSTFPDPPNSGSGKLTLLEIRVYNGEKSEETALAPYVFTYSTINPNFSYLAADRWGKYQPNTITNHPLELFPYANQIESEIDENSSAWKLVKIRKPAGSELEIEYESDSYRYVQNKRAMDLIEIAGYASMEIVGESIQDDSWSTSNATNTIYSEIDKNVVIVKLNEAITASTIEEAAIIFREQYLKQYENLPVGQGYLNEVYLRNFVKIKETSGWELIPTFAKINDHSVFIDGSTPVSFPATGVVPGSSGTYEYGYITLQQVISNEDEKNIVYMSPVVKTALEFSRLHLAEIVFGTCDGCDPDLTVDKFAFWNGDIYKEMAEYGYCNEVDLYKSEIRLFDHDNKKYGGNARVKKITIRDNWNDFSDKGNTITGEEDGIYHWDYTYEIAGVAHGVAAYEPMSGNDENSFYRWSRYTNKSVSFPDETHFSVIPIGEILYPNPVVGYNYVKITMSHDSGNNVDLGYSVNKFFTACDYPTKSNSTTIAKVNADWTNYISTEIDLFGLSQGHSVVTNDFHGKIKEIELYSGSTAGTNSLISRTTYRYRNLGTDIPMLDEKGVLGNYQVGMEYDLHADSRFVKNISQIVGIGLKINFLTTLPFTPTSFSPIIIAKYNETGFYTSCFNKHVNYSAIVESIETENFGNVNTARNLVYDKYSGNVLLSGLTDEYNESLYSLSYPAHWYYTLLRNPLNQATASVSGTFTAGGFTAGSGTIRDKFSVGDVVESAIGATTTELYVLSVHPSDEKVKLIMEDGTSFSGSGSGTLILKKSGRKNILGPSIQSVITKRNPLVGGFTFPAEDVIEISAVTLKPRTNVQCDTEAKISVAVDAVINPFDYGLLNNLMQEYQYSLQVNRLSSETQGIRYNGTLDDFVPFYGLGTDDFWYKINESDHPDYDALAPDIFQNWRKGGELKTVDERGQTLTVLDPLNVPSSMLYGYNNLSKIIPVAQAVNAEQHQIAFDSFEDYDYLITETITSDIGHFDFKNAILANPEDIAIDANEKHSGLKSLRVGQGAPSANVTRDVTIVDPDCHTTGTFVYGEDEYIVDNCMCVAPFQPDAGKYIVGLWVKGNSVNSSTLNYNDVEILISFAGSSTTYTFYPTGQKLDGWQRIEGKFSVPPVATSITVSLKNTSSVDETNVYFDDIRIHPFLAGMTTSVYDPSTLLLMATHDGYNFTTFYNYDENLNLVRVRVETVEGIRTVSESEKGIKKDFKN